MVDFRLQRRSSYLTMFAAAAKIREPLIIGNDFLQDNKGYITMYRDKIEFNKYAPKVRRLYRI
jgi:hypothetical protein